jgi:hypothetical protein
MVIDNQVEGTLLLFDSHSRSHEMAARRPESSGGNPGTNNWKNCVNL